MYVVGTLLAPTAGRTIDLALLPLVEDVSSIKTYDWCSYVYKKLRKAIKRYKDGLSSKNCNGCLLVLVICYLHMFPIFGMNESVERPLIKHWTTSKLRKRVKDERSILVVLANF